MFWRTYFAVSLYTFLSLVTIPPHDAFPPSTSMATTAPRPATANTVPTPPLPATPPATPPPVLTYVLCAVWATCCCLLSAAAQMFSVSLWCMDEYWQFSIFTLLMLIFFESTVVKRRLRNLATLQMHRLHYDILVFRGNKWGQWRSLYTWLLLCMAENSG